MKAPKYLVLDKDLQVIGMASSYAALLNAFGLKADEGYHFYKCLADIPDESFVGLGKILKNLKNKPPLFPTKDVADETA